jgi:hypothetical protein
VAGRRGHGDAGGTSDGVEGLRAQERTEADAEAPEAQAAQRRVEVSDAILVRARKAAEMLDVDVAEVYILAAAGHLGVKRYIGKGTRAFRLEVAAVKAYVDSLPTEPVDT